MESLYNTAVLSDKMAEIAENIESRVQDERNQHEAEGKIKENAGDVAGAAACYFAALNVQPKATPDELSTFFEWAKAHRLSQMLAAQMMPFLQEAIKQACKDTT